MTEEKEKKPDSYEFRNRTEKVNRKQLFTVFYTRIQKHQTKLAGIRFKINKDSSQSAMGRPFDNLTFQVHSYGH